MASKVTYSTLSTNERASAEYEAALERFRHELDEYHPMYIGGEEVQSEEGEFEHRSPIDTSIVVGHFQKGTRRHARLAIEVAKRSLETWNAMQWQEHVRIMCRAADLIDERKFEIAAAITYEVGKTRLEATAEASEAVDAIRYYAKIMKTTATRESLARARRERIAGWSRSRMVCDAMRKG